MMPEAQKSHKGHGATQPIPAEVLLSDDFELHLVRAPLVEPGTSCRYEACESDEVCTCQEPLYD